MIQLLHHLCQFIATFNVGEHPCVTSIPVITCCCRFKPSIPHHFLFISHLKSGTTTMLNMNSSVKRDSFSFCGRRLRCQHLVTDRSKAVTTSVFLHGTEVPDRGPCALLFLITWQAVLYHLIKFECENKREADEGTTVYSGCYILNML